MNMILILISLVVYIQGETYYLNKNLQVGNISPKLHQRGASGEFNNSVNTTGWAFLKITTSQQDPDIKQFYYAGFIEGYLTKVHCSSIFMKDLIFDAYRNYISSVLNGSTEIAAEATQFVREQTQWMQEQCQQGGSFWDQVCNLLQQQQGLYDGYIRRIIEDKTHDQYLDYEHFYYLTNMGDLEDIIPSFSQNQARTPNCNTLFKLTKDKNLIVGHNTHNLFSLMLRVYKTYSFQLNDPNIRANLSFSSRPGDLESKDDFYMLRESKLVVTETSLNNYNDTNYQFLHSKSLPTWVRVSVASRLAADPTEWAHLFSLYRSGTHNNQWIVATLDASKILQKDSIVMVEESFFLYKTIDITESLLLNNSYVASYNIAFNQEIYDIANYASKTQYNYWTDSRAAQFQVLHHQIETPLDLGQVIRSNLNQSYGLCLDSICPRCDLSARNWTFGGIDGIIQTVLQAKVVDMELLDENKVLLISSPSYQNLDPFNWQDHRNISHHGMPDEWKFPWFIYNQDTFTIEQVQED